ncbi:MAG: hypothetical protein U9Q81_26195 [Pseudomonadota bacterium]|nr:hypothetical protein [Pseudomonadota bacterium]
MIDIRKMPHLPIGLTRGIAGLLLVFFDIVSEGCSVFAADIRFLGEEDDTFHISLSGPIADGDKDRLAAAVQPALRNEEIPPWYRAISLHLNSPGGNLQAGLDVVEFIVEHYIGTVIDDGAECYSACALIFMSGNGVTRNFVETYINRELHVGGNLGFHAPYVKFQGVGYNAAIKQLGRMLKLLDNKGSLLTGKHFLKHSLIAELLLRSPKEIFNIDTVDKAGRWDIALTGFSGPPRLSLEHFKIACDNAISWKRDSYSSGIIASELSGNIREIRCGKWEGCRTKYLARLKMPGTQVSRVVFDVGCDVIYQPSDTYYPVRIATWEQVQPQTSDTLGDLGQAWWFYEGKTRLSNIRAQR